MEFLLTMSKEKWQNSNNERLVAYNKSDEKRQQISEFLLIYYQNVH